MKPVQLMLLLVTLAGLAMAQNAKNQGQTASQQPPAATAPQGKTPPQAKTQDEFKAYQEASQLSDAAAAEKAADDFAAKFNTSELRYLLYYRALTLYQNANNAEKAIEMGHKVLAINPNEPITLAMVANFIAERTRDTDLDRDERLKEAMDDAQKSLQYLDTELIIPAGMPQERIDANKNLLRSIAYAAIGNSYMAKEDYPQAEVYLKKSLDAGSAQPDPVTWLRYTVVLDHQKKYAEAMTAANTALELSPPGSPQAGMAKQERDRLLKLTGAAASAPATSTTSPKP